ncbi:hypothetical protein, partial [Escherichia coli]|uniref:hypothetical protein n=1 Tax=Escherichia coli TaxID=562 RepID=UPI0032E4E93D
MLAQISGSTDFVTTRFAPLVMVPGVQTKVGADPKSLFVVWAAVGATPTTTFPSSNNRLECRRRHSALASTNC